ncbi:hypothetical protein FRC02_006760 [Tulasnella sp. 418]|nr:hypothetical protein FRC02_006760 [Tulasnella sp. 418]
MVHQRRTIQRLSTIADRPKGTEKRDVYPVSQISSSEISSYTSYTNLARAAYCASNIVATWACGAACRALPGMVIYLTGGNGQDVPNYYVGYLPSIASAVVVHEGTSPDEIESLLVDANFFFDELEPAYFPGIGTAIKIHNGFTNAHAKSSPAILNAVKKILSERGVSKVTLVGHSLGGAIAILDAMSLRLTLPSTTKFKIVTYGQPRVGNQEFADYVDRYFPDYARITNDLDIVPIVPGRFLGFRHSSFEKHVTSNGVWYACSGQDNEADPYCSTGAVDNIFVGNTDDHSGPYNGILISGCAA